LHSNVVLRVKQPGIPLQVVSNIPWGHPPAGLGWHAPPFKVIATQI
jgi:hypothetical protein